MYVKTEGLLFLAKLRTVTISCLLFDVGGDPYVYAN